MEKWDIHSNKWSSPAVSTWPLMTDARLWEKEELDWTFISSDKHYHDVEIIQPKDKITVHKAPCIHSKPD